MNDLGTASITSMEVAEMTGKIHKNLIRSIETYMKHFSQLNFEPAKYFNLSTYLDEQEKERKCYNITKKGCEFIAHKMTGIKGTEFTVKYIERFHEMEQAISQQEVLEQKQEKKSLSQWTPEEIVDWKLNDLHKRLQKIEKLEEEKPKIGRLQRLVPKKKTWYDRNKSRIWQTALLTLHPFHLHISSPHGKPAPAPTPVRTWCLLRFRQTAPTPETPQTKCRYF